MQEILVHADSGAYFSLFVLVGNLLQGLHAEFGVECLQ